MSTKKTAGAGEDGEHVNGCSPSPTTESPSLQQLKQSAKTKTAPPHHLPPPPQQQPVLVICRNKHWRYISSFHGPWLQLPPEILETIANASYNTPRPRPIDPAVFFDLVKIRRLVDDATNLAVRAASGVASIGQRNLPGASHHAAALGFGFGPRPPPHTKLSAERRHRMREQASQKLAKAYGLDEIACSVATMQSASSLEEVASLVLQRNPQDPDAKYVHFFHEKIPSRQLAECTSLVPLNEVVAARPTDPEPLRTRAMVRIFKGDYQGAVMDLTEALKLFRLYRPSRASSEPPSQDSQLSERQLQQQNVGRRVEDIILKEEDQPSSLEMQVLFQRAGVYLSIACHHVSAALGPPTSPVQGEAAPGPTPMTQGHPDGDGQTVVPAGQPMEPQPSPAEREAQRKMVEARKLVRHNAKRALRDYTAYLSHFEYSPDLPIEIAEDFTRKVNSAVNGVRAPRSQRYLGGPRSPLQGKAADASHRVFALSELFTSSPPTGLPPYPSTELAPMRPQQLSCSEPVQTTTEILTCHPLLTDALHALLLCHCLIQTPAKELLRHAYMVARLARLADGYPVFQSSRCPARADWIEVLRAGNNWIQLAGSWEDLCAPAPLPLFQSTGGGSTPVPISLSHSKAPKPLPAPDADGATITDSDPQASSTPGTTAVGVDRQRQDRLHSPAALDALTDERVSDESALRLAIRARQLRAEHDYRLDGIVTALDAKLARRELESFLAANSASSPRLAASPGPNPTSTGTPSPIAVAPPFTSADTSSGAAAIANGTTGAKKPVTPTSTRPRPGNLPTAAEEAAVPRDHYPISTDRATVIARWVLEAPPPNSVDSSGDGAGMGVGKRRRKTTAAKKKPSSHATGQSPPPRVGPPPVGSDPVLSRTGEGFE
ncbi:hypothetical protein VTK26DRAFT_8771 [Humicola hyalothermophila]